MGIKKEQMLVFLMLALFVWGIISGAYIYRFRKIHIASSASYKKDIEGLQEEIAVLHKRKQSLQAEVNLLKEEIVSQSVNITNGASQSYSFQVALEDASMNDAIVDDYERRDFSRIIVAGHIYGNPQAPQSNSPSQTLMDSLAEINELEPDLFLSLGDMVYAPSSQAFNDLKSNFLFRVNAPLLNAPGNHDLGSGRGIYESYFGQTFFYTKYLSAQIVVLDTELANCYIVGRQKEMLQEALTEALRDEEIQHIFIFLHKLLFLSQEQIDMLRVQANGSCYFGTNYAEIRDEILLPAAERKNVYLIAGDVGALDGNLSPLYIRSEETQLHSLAIGLGYTDSDALLQIDFSADKLEFQLLPLGDMDFLPLENYDLEYWSVKE